MNRWPVQWHADRRKAILHAHPEVRQLYGHDPTTVFWLIGLATVQISMTFYAARLSWPVAMLLAYGVAAFPAHTLGLLIHESGHNLVFRRPWANKVFAILANVPLGAPAAVEFRAQHALHHRNLGEADGRDTQAPTRQEVALVGTSSWRKLVSFAFGRFYYRARPANHVPFDKWMALNWIACLGYAAIVLWLGGIKSLAFVVVAGLAAFGPHTLGARRIAEHLTARKNQPTNSYYSPLNRIMLNVGYHVEHHDFPNIPWRRLPELRAIAPELYEPLFSVRSYTVLMLKYLLSPRYRVDQYIGMSDDWLEED